MPTNSSDSQASSTQVIASVVPLVPAWRVDRSFDYAVGDLTVVPGSLVRIPFSGRRIRGIVVDLEERVAESDLETIAAVVTSVPIMPPSMRRLFEWLAERYVSPRGRAFARAVPPRVRVSVDPLKATVDVAALSELARYDRGTALLEHLRAGRDGVHCIQVLPGSDRGGLIAELLAAAQGPSIVAVPEVRYGSIVIDELAHRVDGLVRVDSAIGEAGRARGWLQFAAGSSVAVGGRAAVLAPSQDLALVIIDEEHHQTYKEDRAPRYHAVHVAIERARIQHAACVLLSATPSLESAWRTKSSRGLWISPTRAARRNARPVVELVERPSDRSLSPELHARIADRLRANERVALLAPSGAFARAVWCAECRRSLRCPQCEAGLFYERARSTVRCVRCGYRSSAPTTCPTCGAADFRFVGAGSERLGEQLTKTFPRARVVRVDPTDPAAADAARADIYVTTWAGTKRELRPDVSLVGVLDADWLLRRPDFRAAESAYQALVEMAAWAGSADDGGHLVVQTADAAHHGIQALVRADYEFFYERELEVRRELAYPPFSELIRLSADGSDAMDAVRDVVTAVARDGVVALGPVRRGAPGGAQALLKCRSALDVARDLRAILSATTTNVMVDVDPR